MADQNQRLAEITEQVNYELERFGRLSGTTADSLRDAQVGVEGFSAAMRKAPGQVADAAGKMAKAMYDGQKGASAFNSSIDSMAGAAQSATTMLMAIIPGGVAVKVALMALNKAIGFAAEAIKQVNIQGDALYKSYQDLAKSGAVAAGGTTQLGEDIYKLGIGFQDLDKYLGLVNESSQDLALFGRTVFEGSADFANLRQTMKPMRAEFERLGLNAEQQNEAVMGYIRLQTRLGNASRLQEQGYAATAEAARKYIMEQDALTKVTGISRKEQEKAMEEAMRNQRFAATLDQLVAEGRTKEAENLRVMVQASGQLGPQFQKGMTDLASGFANTEEARQVQLATQGDALKQFDMVKQGLIKAPGEIDRAQQSIYNNVAAFNKNMQPLAAAGAYDKTFGSYAEQRRAQELKGEKFAAAMAKSREETAKQMAGTDDRLAAQSNTVVNQQDAMLESQKLMDRAITGAAEASEFASEKLAKLARMANDAADALGSVKTEAKGFWGQVLKSMGIDTTPREKTEKEQQLADAEEAAKQAAERAAAERAATAEAKKQAEAALEAERKALKEAQSQSDRAKAQLQGVGTQAGVNFDVQRLQRQEREATAKVDSAGTDQERKKAQEDAERIRLRLSESMAEQRRLQGIVAEQGRIAEAAKAAVAQREAAAAEARKKDADAKATEDKATRDSLRAQYQTGMGGERPMDAQAALKASAQRQEREKDTAALGKINETLTRQRENLKANTDQLAKLDKTRDKATIKSLERINETIAKRIEEQEKEAEDLKEKIKKNQPKPAPSAPRPPGTASSSGAGGGRGSGGNAGGQPYVPSAAPGGGAGGGAAPGGAAPGGAAPGGAAPGGAAPGGAAPAASSGVPTAASENLLSYIRSTEHFTPTAKWDAKQWSNGYGTKAKFPTGNATDPGPRETITKEEAETRFIQFVNQAAQQVGAYGNSKKYKWGQNQVDALTSFIYNGGSGWLDQVTKDGKRKNFEIAEAMLEYNKSNGKTLPGLVNRRQYESNLFKKDLQAADGGVFSGPKSGYPATLHGTEAVIPLKNGEVPVNIDNKDADQLQTDVRNLTANVIRLTQKDVMAPGGIGPTMGGQVPVHINSDSMSALGGGGWSELQGYNMGAITTDIAVLQKIAGKLGAYDASTKMITDPKLWKEILQSGMLMNYDVGAAKIGTKGMSEIVGAETVADAIAGRIKELINNRQDSTEAIAQTRIEFADMMHTFYTDFFAKMQEQMAKENPLDSEMLAVLKDISQTNAAAAGSSEKMLRHARN